ncbi:MAG: DUF4837 family protein, partial [Paludibacteraceae bacterium]|nr:DUF4837 family protein [Paludibacteraceae bacterium]
MRKSIFFALIALVMISCGKSNERLLTSATGSIYECLVICNETLKEPVSTTMGADMYGLPQMEPYFTVSHVTPAQFDDLFKSSRNILLVDVNEHKYTQLKVQHSRDVWSKPQAFIRIQAPSNEDFLAYWQTNGEAVREWFVREEMARQISFYRANTNKDARAKLKQWGYDMLIPEDFITIKSEQLELNGESVDVVWCCNNKGPMRKDVLVYSFPYTAQEQFSNEAIIAMRDEVVGQLVSAQVEGSHMGTEFKHFPPVTRQVPALRDTVGGFYAMETRGLWRILDGEAMGGPFVSLTRLDQVNGRVVTAEAFVYAPGQKKRNAMRQTEAILYSLKMPN